MHLDNRFHLFLPLDHRLDLALDLFDVLISSFVV